MKDKNELWFNIGAILICLGIFMSVGVILYKCFITSLSLTVFVLGLIMLIIGMGIWAIKDK